jgi:hypothetical protein
MERAMTTMITEIYDALREGGTSEEKARLAAQTLANYDDKFSSIERRLSVLTWQVGALVAVQILAGAPAIWLLLKVASKVGAIG